MPRGRPRKLDPSIPAHIDQRALPKGIYWDRRDRVWYAFVDDADGVRHRRKLASANVRLSELHTLIEALGGNDAGTLGKLCELHAESRRYRLLSPKTQEDYEAQRKLVRSFRTRAGLLKDLRVDILTPSFLQRVIDKIADTYPSKANHLLRYLRAVFSWGIRRGHCSSNPAKGLEQAKERKQRRLPAADVYDKMLAYARANHTDYLWIAMELAYLLRLRGIEVVTLTDAHVSPDEGIQTNRRKGSRDSLVQWSPRLRAAHDAAIERRKRIWDAKKIPTPLRSADRRLLVNDRGQALSRRALSSLWQTMMVGAVEDEVIMAADRFGAHDLKRKGITETAGNRSDKQAASGHKAEAMLDVYDLSIPRVTTPGDV